MNNQTIKTLMIMSFLAFGCLGICGQTSEPESDAGKVERILTKAVAKLGGNNYRGLTSLSSSGKLSILDKTTITSFQSFVDVIIYPDRERTDFSERGSKTIQVNTGDTGWIFDETFERFGPQTEKQIGNFKRGLKTHYDFLLRGEWKDRAQISHAGRRRSSLGKRNDVLKLVFEDEFWVEYEFSDEGLPMKTVYPSKNSEGALVLEENRYAQFLLTDGVLYPFIVDHFSGGLRTYRVNYIKVRMNLRHKDSIFVKPENPKKIKKLKL